MTKTLIEYCIAGATIPDTCIMCLEDMESTNSFRQLPCEHLFHQPCIDDWICNRDTKCPLCRTTFYDLRQVKQKETPARSINNRRTSQGQIGRLDSFKGWCKKKWNGSGEGPPSVSARWPSKTMKNTPFGEMALGTFGWHEFHDCYDRYDQTGDVLNHMLDNLVGDSKI